MKPFEFDAKGLLAKNFNPRPDTEGREYFLIRRIPPYYVARIYPVKGRIVQSSDESMHFAFACSGRMTLLGELTITDDEGDAFIATDCINKGTSAVLDAMGRNALEMPFWVETDTEKEYFRIGVTEELQ